MLYIRKFITRAASTYSGLPNSIYVLFVVRIINAMGNFVYPFLTFFLKDLLNMKNEQISFFMLLVALSSMVGNMIGGKLADKMGRKRIIVVFQSCAALALFPCVFLGNSRLIPFLIILSQLFNGSTQPANTAMITDLTNKDNRKTAFSLLYLGINIGFSIGPVIAGYLFKNFISMLFIGNVTAMFISVILVSWFVEETMPSESTIRQNIREANKNENAESGGILKALLLRPQLLVFAAISSILSFSYSQSGYVTPLYVKEIFGEAGYGIYGTLMMVNGMVVVLMTTVIVGVTRKIKPILNVSVACLFFAFGFGMMYFTRSYFGFIVSTIIWTTGEILSSTNSGVYIASHTPITHRARFNAVIPIISGLGSYVGPVLMGLFLKGRELKEAWVLVSSLLFIAFILMYILYWKEKSKAQKN